MGRSRFEMVYLRHLVPLLFSCFMLDVEAYTSPAGMAQLEQVAVLAEERADFAREHAKEHQVWPKLHNHAELGEAAGVQQGSHSTVLVQEISSEHAGEHLYERVIARNPTVFMKAGGKVEDCACNGKTNSKGQGGNCGFHSFRTNWCYVNAGCADKAAVNAQELPGNMRLYACQAENPIRKSSVDLVAQAKAAAEEVLTAHSNQKQADSGVMNALKDDFHASKELSTSKGVLVYAKMQEKNGEGQLKKWSGEAKRMSQLKALNSESAHFQKQTDMLTDKITKARAVIDSSKAVQKLAEFKIENAGAAKLHADVALTKAKGLSSAKLKTMKEKVADQSLADAEKATSARFSWKAQKAEWHAQGARDKLSRASIVLTAAKLAKQNAVKEHGGGSDQAKAAIDNFARAEKAHAQVKKAYGDYERKLKGETKVVHKNGVQVETKGNKVVVTFHKAGLNKDKKAVKTKEGST